MKERLGSLLKKIGSGIGSLFKALPLGKIKDKMGFKGVLMLAAIVFLIFFVISLIVGHAPGSFEVRQAALDRAGGNANKVVTGYVTTSTMVTLVEKMLNKPGGYMSNDKMPPMVFMDDIPAWELGMIKQVRDTADTLRNDFSRSRSQSLENPDLATASPQYNFQHDSWILPTTEKEYRKGNERVLAYLDKLSAKNVPDAQFYARADNLAVLLSRVEIRLGGYSQRLSASVGQKRANTDLAGDQAAEQSTPGSRLISERTPWLKIDDVFFESRGYAYGLIHMLEAIKIDFDTVLEKKNAHALLDQIIRELKGTQRMVWSPMILNGSGFGLFANHSLVMASYISRANAAVIDLRDLLAQG